MVNLDEYKKLEELGVYFHYSPELYDDGCNLNFSIEFKNYDTQTGWYNDNHEFGDVYSTMTKSIQLAYWYLEDPKRIEIIDSGYHNPEYMSYQDEVGKFIHSITNTIDNVYDNFIHNPSYNSENYSDLISSQAGQLVKCPTKEDFITKLLTDDEFYKRWGNYCCEELTYIERYNIWIGNNYETGVEYNPEIIPQFDNEYYEPTPKRKLK